MSDAVLQPTALERAVAERVPLVGTLVEELTATARQVEAAVVQVCEGFERIVATAREAAQTDGTGTRGVVAPLIEHTRGTLQSLIAGILERSTTFLRTAEELSGLDEGMRRIERTLARVDGVAAQTRILALNASIAAARVGDRGREFSVVASEMKKLADASRQTSRDIGEIVHALRLRTGAASASLRELSQREIAEAERRRGDVDDTLSRLHDVHDELEAALVAGANRQAELAHDVQAAVVGMQFQDVTSQRLERVMNALRVLEEELVGALPAPLRAAAVAAAPPPMPAAPAPSTGDVELF